MQHDDGVGVDESHDPQEQILVARRVIRRLLLEVQPGHFLPQSEALLPWKQDYVVRKGFQENVKMSQ